MSALVPADFQPVRHAGELTCEAHGEIIRRILFEHGRAMPLKNLALVLVDLGIIVLEPQSTLHLYPTHPYRQALRDIVLRLYHEGQLAGLGGLKPLEADHGKIWPE